VGVARTLVRFHAMVIIWFSAILKKLVAVCGSCVMLVKPGGSVCAIEGALETVLEAGGGVGADADTPDAPGALDGAPEMGQRRTWRSQQQIGIVRKAQPPLMTCRFTMLAAFHTVSFNSL
jgi:hypothetical protein